MPHTYQHPHGERSAGDYTNALRPRRAHRRADRYFEDTLELIGPIPV
jgi:hypothetical protein